MYAFFVLTLATFWAWETVRYAATRYAPGVWDVTRVIHPLLVAAIPLLVLWPDWVEALAVAGAVGIVHLAVERLVGSPAAPQVVSRPRRAGLPPLP